MSIRRRTSGSATVGATAVDISHTDDSIRIGNGTDLMDLVTEGATISIPVSLRNTAIFTGGTQKTKITDGTNDAALTLVGAKYAIDVNVVQTVGGGGGTGTSSTDSASFTPASSAFTPIGGAVDDTSSDALAEGEMGIARMTTGRALHVDVRNTVPVSGTFWQATQPVSAASLPLPSGAATETTLASIKTATELLDDMIATLGAAIPSKGSLMAGSDGTLARAVKVDADGHTQVDVLTLPSVTVASAPTTAVTGTFWQATQPVSLASLPSLATGANTIGNVGINGTVPVSGTFWQTTQPVSLASVPTHAVTQSGTWNIGSVSTLPALATGTNHIGNVTLHASRASITQAKGELTTTTAATMLSAAGASTYHDVTKIILTNTDAAAIEVTILDNGTSAMVIGLAANGGAVIDFGAVPLCQTAANTAWTISASAASTGVHWFAQAVKRT